MPKLYVPDIAETGQLRIELRGNLAAMLTAAQKTRRSPETGDLLVPVQMAAGATTIICSSGASQHVQKRRSMSPGTVAVPTAPISYSERRLTDAILARNACGVVPCQRLKARWNAVGSEYPSRYVTSAIESVVSARSVWAACFLASSHKAPNDVPARDRRRCNVRDVVARRRATTSIRMSPAVNWPDSTLRTSSRTSPLAGRRARMSAACRSSQHLPERPAAGCASNRAGFEPTKMLGLDCNSPPLPPRMLFADQTRFRVDVQTVNWKF